MRQSAIWSVRSMDGPSISIPSTARCTIRKAFWSTLWFDCHPSHHGYAKRCLYMLGYIHELWRPMPGRFKDYIANPKANGYQSIHTTVYGPKGPIEFQIRTKEMHQVAEYVGCGPLGHKRGGNATASQKRAHGSTIPSNCRWILAMPRPLSIRLRGWHFTERIYVFTPDGRWGELPKDSVPIDFACKSMGKVGKRQQVPRSMAGWCPDHQAQTGDQVEIILVPIPLGP